ncbi:hypothetical protein PMZ80_001393 [Knufia obscura]|uniref:Myb-like domain-containing protein n=2 Tax=Knufia TaxID=430999 RepID=A0AAN8IAY8_9EURO|nr:hypothetical protein PMZ80_001393 [Knufia obscura]KAK5956210.1 hypothetical protein OHC33_002784 [Knufia fluminis]
MSVTLMATKDGKPKPIKLSIWDAFKGAPPPKPRPHRCNCCNTFHTPGVKPEAAVEATANENADEKPAGDAAKADEAKQDEPTFTEEEDAKLKELKSGPKFTWAKAVEEMGRTQEDLKARWKLIDPSKNEPKSEEKQGKKQNQGKDGEGTQGQKQGKKDKKKKNKQAEQKTEGEETKPDAAAAEEKKEPSQPLQSALDEKKKWEKAASKHFDRTGHRITPEQARKMAEAAT